MRRTVLPSAACPDLPYFSHIISQTVKFLEKYLFKNICVLFSSAHFGEIFLVLITIRPDITTNAHTAYCNVTVILIRVYKT